MKEKCVKFYRTANSQLLKSFKAIDMQYLTDSYEVISNNSNLSRSVTSLTMGIWD